MIAPKTAIAAAAGLAAISLIAWLVLRNDAETVPQGFRVLATLNVDGLAETVTATPDGMRLVHTNPERDSIDIIDISDPATPRQIGRAEMPGRPASVAISPDGQWAVTVIKLSGTRRDPRRPGLLALTDIRRPDAPVTVAWIGIGPRPDSVVVTNAGKDLIALVALENEVALSAAESDEEDDDGAAPMPVDGERSYAGTVQQITIYPANPDNYSVATLRFPRRLLLDAGMLNEDAPQPEYLALSADRSLAALSLQENNGIVVFDPYTLVVSRAFSTGRVDSRPADLRADGKVSFVDTYPDDALARNPAAGLRIPDGLAFSNDGRFLLSADEGSGKLTGGRGFSLWSVNGDLVWDDGGEIEQIAAERGYYDDERSAHRGIEMDGITTARFGVREFAFVTAERGNFLAIYDITNPIAPEFVDMLPSGERPEGVVAIASRALVAVAAEVAGTLTIYAYTADD